MSIKVIIPIVLIVIIYICFCWYDIFKSARTKYLSKWIWALICILSMPLGGILYFFMGRISQEDFWND